VAYTAYERTAGVSAKAFVESLQRQYTNAGTFDTSSTPTLAQVETFLTMGSGEIALKLVSNGYSQAQTESDTLTVLERFNVMAAAELIELSRPTAGGVFTESEPVSRLNAFSSWRRQLDMLIKSNGLSALGANRTGTGQTTGGISISDKEIIETDTDFEPLIFGKDRFQHPETVIATEQVQTEQ
jgi:hypothetical protein